MILSVWSDDEMLSDYFIEDICDGVRLVHIVSSKANEIPLVNVISRRKTLQGNMKNISNLPFVIALNVLMCVVNLYLYFVEYALSSYKELTSSRTLTPHNSRCSINFDRPKCFVFKPVKYGKITIQDSIFWVFKMQVLHHLPTP